jgi:hypothetical protein
MVGHGNKRVTKRILKSKSLKIVDRMMGYC